MSYSDTYQSDPTPLGKREERREEIPKLKRSFVQELCSKVGYNRESFQNIEVESKLNFNRGPDGCLASEFLLHEVKEINFPQPYMSDLEISIEEPSKHDCYVFTDYLNKEIYPAFTAVGNRKGTKIKIKKNEKVSDRGIFRMKYIIQREEQHIPCNSEEDLSKAIPTIEEGCSLPIDFLGSFQKRSREQFLFNYISGRIFVISNGVAYVYPDNEHFLRQIEIEYYGRINGYSPMKKDVEDELFDLTDFLSKFFQNTFTAKPTKLTKLEWLASVNNKGVLIGGNEQIREFKLIKK